MESYLNTFMASLREMKKNKNKTDVTLKLPDKSTIPCHKLILEAASPFFETMFRSGLKESLEPEVQLTFADADTIRILVDFIYSGEIDINEENVQTLVEASEFLLLKDLKAACEGFMATLVCSTNIRELSDYGKKFDLKMLLNGINEFIIQHFEEVVSSSCFEALTEEELQQVVSDNRLKTKSEDSVFEAVVCWVNHNPHLRKEAFVRIAPFIRFPLCSRESLLKVVGCEPLMWKPECMQLFAEAQESQFHAGTQPVNNSRTTPRCTKKDYLVRMYNDEKDEICFEYCADLKAEHVKWKSKCIEVNFKINSCAAISSQMIWMNNGTDVLGVQDFDSIKITMHPWVKPTNDGCTLDWVNGKMLAVGGTNSTHEHYTSFWDSIFGIQNGDNSQNFQISDLQKPPFTWVSGPNVPKAVDHLSVVGLKHQIFILGNYIRTGSDSQRLMQMFNCNTRKWELCCPIPSQYSAGEAIVVLTDKIYVVGGKDRVCLSYDVERKAWGTLHSRPLVASTKCCATVWKGEIILSAQNESICQVYDSKANRWSLKRNTINKNTKHHDTELLCVMRF